MKDRTDQRCCPGKGDTKAEGWRRSCQVAREEGWWEGEGLLDRGNDMMWSGARAGASAAILWQEAVVGDKAGGAGCSLSLENLGGHKSGFGLVLASLWRME